MTSPWHDALAAGPMAVYLGVVAYWQGGRHPRVVGGKADFALLACAVAGPLGFGPFGDLLARMLARDPGAAARLAVVAALGLAAGLAARGSSRRLVVYGVGPEALTRAVESALAATGRFGRVLGGYEDRSSARGVRVEVSRGFRCATVEAHGRGAEGLIGEVRPRLERALRAAPPSRSPVTLALLGSILVVAALPLIGQFLNRPNARATLRTLFDRLRGG